MSCLSCSFCGVSAHAICLSVYPSVCKQGPCGRGPASCWSVWLIMRAIDTSSSSSSSSSSPSCCLGLVEVTLVHPPTADHILLSADAKSLLAVVKVGLRLGSRIWGRTVLWAPQAEVSPPQRAKANLVAVGYYEERKRWFGGNIRG